MLVTHQPIERIDCQYDQLQSKLDMYKRVDSFKPMLDLSLSIMVAGKLIILFCFMPHLLGNLLTSPTLASCLGSWPGVVPETRHNSMNRTGGSCTRSTLYNLAMKLHLCILNSRD